eukprot:1300148-Amorphochlora_amoeboformis.AAC.1
MSRVSGVTPPLVSLFPVMAMQPSTTTTELTGGGDKKEKKGPFSDENLKKYYPWGTLPLTVFQHQ